MSRIEIKDEPVFDIVSPDRLRFFIYFSGVYGANIRIISKDYVRKLDFYPLPSGNDVLIEITNYSKDLFDAVHSSLKKLRTPPDSN